MPNVVDFELAVERIGFVFATVLFRDRLPENFWGSLTIEQCFDTMDNYPTRRCYSKGQDDNEEEIFRKEAYQSAQIKLLSIVDASRSFEELNQAYALSGGDHHEWWYHESTIRLHDFRLRVILKMIEIEPKTTERWKKIRYYSSAALRQNYRSADGYPRGDTQRAFEEIRAQAATEIFSAALTAEDWHYLYTDEGTDNHTYYSGEYLAGLTTEQHIVVSKRCAVFYGEIFGEEVGEAHRILDYLPEDATERETILDILERSDYYFPVICGYVGQDSKRFKRVLARMKKENTFSCWIRFCTNFFNKRGKFFQTCLERAMPLAAKKDELEKILRYLDKKDPRRHEFEEKLVAVEAAAGKKRDGRGRKRKKASISLDATLN